MTCISRFFSMYDTRCRKLQIRGILMKYIPRRTSNQGFLSEIIFKIRQSMRIGSGKQWNEEAGKYSSGKSQKKSFFLQNYYARVCSVDIFSNEVIWSRNAEKSYSGIFCSIYLRVLCMYRGGIKQSEWSVAGTELLRSKA